MNKKYPNTPRHFDRELAANMCDALRIDKKNESMQIHTSYMGWRVSLWLKPVYPIEKHFQFQELDLGQRWETSSFRMLVSQTRPITIIGAP